jgi:hypothetical protein
VVKQIFQLAADGLGHKRILGTLTREGVPAFGEVVLREGRSRSQYSGRWNLPYLDSILNDRRAVGEYQPRKIDGTPDGPPLVGYLPAAVSEELFLLARAGQERRRNNNPQARQRQGKYVNVFKALLRHAREGEGVVLHNRGTRERPELVLANKSGVVGRGACYTFPYRLFEDAVLSWLPEITPSDVLPHQGDEQSKADALRARLAAVRQNLAQVQAELKAGFSKALATVLREQEVEEERIALELQEELARSTRPAARAFEDVPGLVALLKTAEDPDTIRLRLRTRLRRAIADMRVLFVPRGAYRLAMIQVVFDGGAQRTYFIAYLPPGNRRTGRWWHGSWDALEGVWEGVVTDEAGNVTGTATADAWDLRQPDDVVWAEKFLQTCRLPPADAKGWRPLP